MFNCAESVIRNTQMRWNLIWNHGLNVTHMNSGFTLDVLMSQLILFQMSSHAAFVCD